MGNPLRTPHSPPEAPITNLAYALTQAKTGAKNVAPLEVNNIQSIRACAEEIHIVLRLFF
jgi:hypothetical protein